MFGKGVDCTNPHCSYRREREIEIYRMLAQRAQIPQAYRGMNFERWAHLQAHRPELMVGKEHAYLAALAFARESASNCWVDAGDGSEPRNSLVFAGPNGVGKTSLACSIAHDLLNKGMSVLYLRLGEYFDRLRERFEAEGDRSDGMGATEMDVARTAQRVPVLVIDEFGVEQVSEWKRDQAEKLINFRRSHDLPTVVTTNLTVEKLSAAWGAKTGVRLQEMSHWIEMGGPELRARSSLYRSF
jgi:DNA replication protein DnaC